MSQKKTLVVILCMHRCGSSLTARLLRVWACRWGRSSLGEANESNKYGHFEAQPFVLLNRELQLPQFGFEGDMPDDAEAVRRYCQTGGRWTSESAIDDELIVRGRGLIDQLMASGQVCGFKDPRTVLTWPFWQRVLAGLPELRIVPLVLLRGPHEIAMSIFRRSQGDRDYHQALDVTAVHFRRMKEIIDQWPGSSAVVQFDPAVYGAQARQAAELCGLAWSDAALAESYDASCRHFEAAPVEHPAASGIRRAGRTAAQRANHERFSAAFGRRRRRGGRVAARQEECTVAREERDAACYQREVARYERDVALHECGRLQNVERAPSSPSRHGVAAGARNSAGWRANWTLIRGLRTWRVHQAVSGAALHRQNDGHTGDDMEVRREAGDARHVPSARPFVEASASVPKP